MAFGPFQALDDVRMTFVFHLLSYPQGGDTGKSHDTLANRGKKSGYRLS